MTKLRQLPKLELTPWPSRSAVAPQCLGIVHGSLTNVSDIATRTGLSFMDTRTHNTRGSFLELVRTRTIRDCPISMEDVDHTGPIRCRPHDQSIAYGQRL